ncbi:MAG: ANTAR domain-containing response regulator [Micrococcales bacterium]
MSETTAKKVLVAEDEALIRMDIVETLRDSEYLVVGDAGDGQEALELAEELQPDLIVMDIKMPRMDGITAARHFAEKRIPVVLLTAFSQKELFEQAAQAGAMAYVVKPFNPNDLLPAIQIALHRHAELKAFESEIADLNERLETRKLVERAKGLLLAKKLVPDEPEAFRWIQKASMDRRLTMKDVAKTIVEQLADKA